VPSEPIAGDELSIAAPVRKLQFNTPAELTEYRLPLIEPTYTFPFRSTAGEDAQIPPFTE